MLELGKPFPGENTVRNRLLTFAAVMAATMVGFLPAAQAGAPLVCFPFDIGEAKSLPWSSGSDWNSPSAAYDVQKLVPDTLALLEPGAPVLVRMETLRRAAIYSSKQPRLAYELLSKLMGRALDSQAAGKANSLALFDAGYLVETLRQAGWESDTNLVKGLDGYAWTVEAIRQGGGNPDMEFGASLMEGMKSWPNGHFRNASAAAKKGSLLAKNLEKYQKH